MSTTNKHLDSAPKDSSPSVTWLKQLWPYVARHRGLLIGWLVALAFSSASTLALPAAFRLVIDHGFKANDGGGIDIWFIGLFAVAIALGLATALRFFFVTLLGEKVIADVRNRVFSHLLSLDQHFFEDAKPGELISRLAADTEVLRSVVGSSMSVAVRSLLTFIGCAIALVWTSPKLAGFAAIGIPLVVVPILLFGKKVRTLSKDSQDRVADSNAHAGETLSAIATVQSFVREAFERTRYHDRIASVLSTAKQRIGMQALLTSMVICLIFGAITTVLWLGARDVIAGDMSAGMLGQFVLYAVIGAGSVGGLAEVWSELLRAAGGMHRIAELLDRQSHITQPTQPHALPQPVHGALSFQNLTFSYPSRPDTLALKNLSLDIKAGETVALVGPSGAGKSTLFALLMRFYEAQSGHIQLDGLSIDQLSLDDLRRQFSIVPQHTSVFAASARDNIRYGHLDADDDAIIAAAKAAEAHDFIMALPKGYDTELGERGAKLSGGQRQRIAIARAVLNDAPILLLDEATSALDAQSERAIQTALTRISANRTTLVIAHRLATVQNADRIIVMQDGQIVAQGTHDSLLAEGGLYAELAKLQFSGS